MNSYLLIQSPIVTSTFTLAAFLMGGTTVPIPYALRCAGNCFYEKDNWSIYRWFVRQAGLFPGLAMLLFAAVLNWYTSWLLVQMSRATCVDSFEVESNFKAPLTWC